VGPAGKGNCRLVAGRPRKAQRSLRINVPFAHGPAGRRIADGSTPGWRQGYAQELRKPRALRSEVTGAFATTIFDFINKSHAKRPGRFTQNRTQVYALTAFLLYKNEIIKETGIIDAKNTAGYPDAEIATASFLRNSRTFTTSRSVDAASGTARDLETAELS